MMRIIFMGTPDFAVPALEALLQAGYPVTAVVTQPDRPRGRGRKLLPGPVKKTAVEHGLPVLQPDRLLEDSFLERLASLAPEVIVVAAFGRILPPVILRLPRLGCLNIHASLLPRYRGAAPIHRAVMNGERETGVSIMLMDEGLDTGAVLARRAVPIAADDCTGAVHDRLARLGAELLLETLPRWEAGEIVPQPQDHAAATYAPPLTGADEVIVWRRPAGEIVNQIRGLSPWPGARTSLDGRLLKIWRAAFSADARPADAVPGRVLGAGGDGLAVAAGDGVVLIRELQLGGGRRLTAEEFLRGHDIPVGTLLGGES